VTRPSAVDQPWEKAYYVALCGCKNVAVSAMGLRTALVGGPGSEAAGGIRAAAGCPRDGTRRAWRRLSTGSAQRLVAHASAVPGLSPAGGEADGERRKFRSLD